MSQKSRDTLILESDFQLLLFVTPHTLSFFESLTRKWRGLAVFTVIYTNFLIKKLTLKWDFFKFSNEKYWVTIIKICIYVHACTYMHTHTHTYVSLQVAYQTNSNQYRNLSEILVHEESYYSFLPLTRLLDHGTFSHYLLCLIVYSWQELSTLCSANLNWYFNCFLLFLYTVETFEINSN